ncbi:MAG: hypothetical protein JOZ19_08345 [Rubrobacter sp.]|nr:hypothetical protein [Rubrobacter sp.]
MSSPVIQGPRDRGALNLLGASLVLITGLIHLVLVPEHLREAPYLGVLFIADFVGAVIAAFGVYQGRWWGWILGALISGGAFAAYIISATVGLPGEGRGHLFEPVGLVTKALEALFLMLCAFKFTESFGELRRWVMVGGVAATLVAVPGVAMALDQHKAHAGHGQRNKTAGLPVKWQATSPATHQGDRYTLAVTNNGEQAQRVRINTMIMDHRTHTNTNVVDKQLKLAPGEERELTAVNDYGTANHFSTHIGSESKDLGLSVKVTDAAGNETAQFNQGAFMG